MQRVKGHGNQGGVRNGTENNEHENVNNWTHQNYNAANASMAAGAYSLSNYYGASYHYPTYCVGDGANAWPNNEAITYMGNYNGQIAPDAAAYGMEGVFGTPAFGSPYGQPATATNATSFNYFPGNATEYQAWNAGASVAPPVTGKQYEDYYREAGYDTVDALKGIDQRIQNLEIASGSSDTNSNKLAEPKYNYGITRTDAFLNSMPSANTSVSSEKKTTWASIAKQPAKPIPQTSSGGSKKKGPGMPPPPMVPGRHNIDLNTWEVKNNVSRAPVVQAPPPPPTTTVNSLAKPVWNGPILTPEPPPLLPPPELSSSPHSHFEPANSEPSLITTQPPPPLPSAVSAPPPAASMPPKMFSNHTPATNRPAPTSYPPIPQTRGPPPHTTPSEPISTNAPLSSSSLSSSPSRSSPPHSVVDRLKDKNNYNPVDLELPPKGTRFFVIKSYSEDDVHRSIKYEIWCSTEHGNKRLDDAFNNQKMNGGAVYLFFSVNGSGHFCGVARMISPVDYGASSSVWAQDKWKGQFRVRWIYVKDVPNAQLRHIRLENNENKPVTNSRDTQEVPYDKGVNVLKIIHAYSHSTSIFDDFTHYEKRQEEGDCNKRGPMMQGSSQHNSSASSLPPHRSNPFGGKNSMYKDRDGGGSSYTQTNHNRRGGRNNGTNFTNHRNQSNNILRS